MQAKACIEITQETRKGEEERAVGIDKKGGSENLASGGREK